MKKIAIYTNKITDNLKIIKDIKDLLCLSNMDFNIFTDSDIIEPIDYAILSSYYMTHYPGRVVFLDIEDLFLFKESLLHEPYCFLDPQNLGDYSIQSMVIKQYSILSYNNNKLELISNEIRQII